MTRTSFWPAGPEFDGPFDDVGFSIQEEIFDPLQSEVGSLLIRSHTERGRWQRRMSRRFRGIGRVPMRTTCAVEREPQIDKITEDIVLSPVVTEISHDQRMHVVQGVAEREVENHSSLAQ